MNNIKQLHRMFILIVSTLNAMLTGPQFDESIGVAHNCIGGGGLARVVGIGNIHQIRRAHTAALFVVVCPDGHPSHPHRRWEGTGPRWICVSVKCFKSVPIRTPPHHIAPHHSLNWELIAVPTRRKRCGDLNACLRACVLVCCPK